jgi:hypothetical protein
MPENQDKKISYKILTAEELLKEEAPSAKKIEYKEEKIEVPVAQKIEGSEEVPAKKEEVKERKEVVEPELKIEAGLIYPEAEKEEELVGKVIIEPPQKVEISIPKPTEIVSPEIKPIKEEIAKEEIFYTPKKEIPFRPKPEILKEEVERKETPEPISSLGEARREFKLPPNILRFVFLGGGVILIFLLILFLKPQEKFKAAFKAKEEKKEEEIKIATPTETVILFPTSAPIILPVSTISTPTQQEVTTPTVISKTQSIPSQTEIKPPEEISFLSNFPSKEIYLKNLNFSTWQEEFENFLSFQEFSGTMININFLYNKNKVLFDFPFDYFIKPTKISSEKIEEFKNNLTGSYGFLIYYGPTRKYPILIFEAKDKVKALKFNQEWEKLTMKEDLKTLFLGLKPPKTKNNFFTKKYKKYSYRILDFGDNFKIIWTLADNYLIYSTTETGLKNILNLLQ